MNTPVELVLARLEERGLDPRLNASGWNARCPAHDDRAPSLGVSDGNDGRALITCRAGCATDDVLAHLELRPADLFPASLNGSNTVRPKIVARYVYEDENGTPVFRVNRWQPGFNDEPKTFRQEHPDGRGGWASGLGEARRVPYRLPQILAAIAEKTTVLVVEGEKDVHAAEAVGLVATCNPMGAGKWRPEYTEHLRGADVVVIADCDEPGRRHAAAVTQALDGIATVVRCAEPRTGKDLCDHLAAGHTVDELVLMEDRWASLDHTDNYDNTSDDTPSDRTSWWPLPLTVEDASDPIEAELLTRTDGVHLLYQGRLNALIGESESCKTWCAYLAVLEVINAGDHALIVDFEDVERTCATRLLQLGVHPDQLARQVHFMHPDEPLLDRHGKITQAQTDLTEALEAQPVRIAIFDGVSEGMVLEGLDPLDNRDIAHWYQLVARRLSRTGAAAVVLDHVTKDREHRGRYALGGVHKLNGLDGAAYILEAHERFAPGRTVHIKLTVAKDRSGAVRQHAAKDRIGQLVLSSSDDGSIVTGYITAGEHAVDDTPFEPTVLMEKISRHLELYPGGETKTELRSLGNSDYIDQAIRLLVERGHIRIEKAGRAHQHYSVTPYREHPDD